ncbi:MAG: hypothetical protein Q4G66_12250, partial [bacterium]|nr:hypothetical protein [bacterium]
QPTTQPRPRRRIRIFFALILAYLIAAMIQQLVPHADSPSNQPRPKYQSRREQENPVPPVRNTGTKPFRETGSDMLRRILGNEKP